MKVGLVVNGAGGLSFDDFARVMKTVERLEISSLFVSDHFVVGEPQDSLEPYLLFAMAAREGRSFRFGPLVTPITFREPWNLGRMAAQLDIMSGGRFVMGLGAGWHEPEHTQFGIPYPPLKERFDRLEEGICVMRAMWGPGPASFTGKHYSLAGADALPKPAAGRPPIMIGGSGERRTLRLTATYADEWNAGNLAAEGYAAKLAVLRQHCETVGRDPADIRLSMMNFALIGPNPTAVDAATAKLKSALAPDDHGSLAEFRATMKARGVLVGGAEEAIDQMGQLAGLGLAEMIFSYQDLSSDEFPAFIASEIMPKTARL